MAAAALTAPSTVDADDPGGELEASLYGGQSHGGWICGPRARARYGGLAAEYRHTTRPVESRAGAGLDVTGGVDLEAERVEIVDCDPAMQACDGPPDQVMLGAGLRAGYRWSSFGISGGFVGYQAWSSASSDKPGLGGWPQLRIIGGPEDGLSWISGTGATLPTTYRRPAVVYTGPQFQSLGEGWRVRAFAGLYRSGPSFLTVLAPRVDVALDWRLAPSWWLGCHTAVSRASESQAADFEAGFDVRLRL